MSPAETVILVVCAFCTSMLTGAVGAGGGTVLIAIMLQLMPPAAAIPVHGAVQLFSNAMRVGLLYRHITWGVALRFAALMPVGVAVGLWLFQGLPGAAIEMLVGGLVLMTLALRRVKLMRERDMPLWAFVPIGLVTGILNIVVGVVAPVLGVLVIRRDMTKEQMVGTLGFFALLGNLLKFGGFALVGFDFAAHGVTILAMIPAVLAGAAIGRWLLARVDERWFLAVFRIVLVALALKLVVYDGLRELLT